MSTYLISSPSPASESTLPLIKFQHPLRSSTAPNTHNGSTTIVCPHYIYANYRTCHDQEILICAYRVIVSAEISCWATHSHEHLVIDGSGAVNT